MTRSLLTLIVLLLICTGCGQAGLPGPAAAPAPGQLPRLALDPRAPRPTPTATASATPQPAVHVRHGAAPAAATPAAAWDRRPPDGFRALESAPAATPTRPPDEPFAYVERYGDQAEILLDTVPALPQLRKLSCEAAAMRMVLAARGIDAGEDEILARMGSSDNPHLGFRGDVNGDGHAPELKDYGAYAEVVERVLRSYGVPATTVLGMSDAALRRTLRSGQAVIVWVTAKDDPLIIEEDGYRLVEEEHVCVAVGLLQDGRVLVHDPWGVRGDSGRFGTQPLWTMQQWYLFDRMAVVVPLS